MPKKAARRLSKPRRWQLWIVVLALALVGGLIFVILQPKPVTAPGHKPGQAKTKAANPQPSTPQPSTGTTSTSPSTAPTAEAPTLPNCQYQGGPPAGRNCPATPPASYSATVPCEKGGNPIACPDWSYTRRIAADYVNGESFCLFDFWGDNGTGAESKKVQVTNNAHPGSIPDCSIEQPLQ